METTDEGLRRWILRLAGPTKDRARLARLVGVSDSTAGGWIHLAEQGTFALDTSVRGEPNKAAKALLIEALESIDSGALTDEGVDGFLRDRIADTAGPNGAETGIPTEPPDLDRRRVRSLLAHAIAQLDAGASVQLVGGIASAAAEIAKDTG